MSNQNPLEKKQKIPSVELKDSDVLVSIPYINVHAFCVSDETVATLQQVGADRRMSRATFEVYVGDVSAAVNFYAEAQTPDILLLEFEQDRVKLKSDLQALSDVCSEKTKVIIIGQVNDVVFYRYLIEMGVSEYVVAPISVVQVIHLIGSMYEEEGESIGRVLAFVGAKGGVGSSTIAHNCAWAISKLFSRKVVLADLDFPFGTSGLNFDRHATQGILDVLDSPDRLDHVMLDRLLEEYDEHLSLLGTFGNLQHNFDFTQNAYDLLIDLLRRSTPFSILDVPHTWSAAIKSVLLAADDIVITVEPDLSNVRNAKEIVDLMKEYRTNERPPFLVLNKVNTPGRPEILPADFCKVLGLTPTAIIESDIGSFYAAANDAKIFADMYSQSVITGQIVEIVRAVTGESHVSPQQEKSSVLSKFFSKLNINKN